MGEAVMLRFGFASSRRLHSFVSVLFGSFDIRLIIHFFDCGAVSARAVGGGGANRQIKAPRIMVMRIGEGRMFVFLMTLALGRNSF